MSELVPKKLPEFTVGYRRYASYLIETYEKSIANVEWHLTTNGRYLSDSEKKICQQRISDFKNFIYELNGFLK